MKIFDDIKKSLALRKCQKELNRWMGSFDNLVANNITKGDMRYLLVAEQIQLVRDEMIKSHGFTMLSIGLSYPRLDTINEYVHPVDEQHKMTLIAKQFVQPAIVLVISIFVVSFVYTTYHAAMTDWFHLLTAPTRW